jgi:hypothetical protein
VVGDYSIMFNGVVEWYGVNVKEKIILAALQPFVGGCMPVAQQGS